MLTVSGCTDYQAGEDAYNRGDYETAFKKFLPLAEQGDARAQVYLGLLYEKGNGVPQNDVQAVKWYRLAAKQGDALGQWYLGEMYAEGRGVPQNNVQAVKWYRLAAEQGDQLGQWSLGEMYYEGRGVPQDYVIAHMWVNLAASQGVENAVKIRDKIATKMTPDQIAEAKRLAREWKAKGLRE